MKHIITTTLIIAMLSSLCFSNDCDTLRNQYKKENADKIFRIILLGISWAAASVCFEFLTPTYRAPNSANTGFSEKQKIAIGCVGIGLTIGIPFETIFMIKSFKKVHKLSDSLELNCSK
jgi:hypothetical protein